MKINVYLSSQSLELCDDEGHVLKSYPVSTALKGAG